MPMTLMVYGKKGSLRSDLIYTPKELYDEIGYGGEDISQYPLYAGELLRLYAGEDIFDESLYKAASSSGIEIVVLTRMVGIKQIVIEVLDTRSRVECFKNLVFKN